MQLTNSMKASWLSVVGAGALATTCLACGASTTPQLADARRAYDDAASSPATTRAPGALAQARVALDRAEQAHDAQPGSSREIELSDRAARKARYAEARAEGRVAAEDDVIAERHGERVAVVNERPVHHGTKHANAALQSLAQVASVKEEPRGVVITLSGSLLFPSGDEQVSPIANQSLDQVAHALAQQPDDATFQIAGYTDSSGSDQANQQLSAKRAQAVADRLQDQGIDSSRISVVGRGEAEPIADNATTEGRASNRRVEIIVARPGKG
jgi:outer membrane protein OmpA-like peptidoglycan-associated protein